MKIVNYLMIVLLAFSLAVGIYRLDRSMPHSNSPETAGRYARSALARSDNEKELSQDFNLFGRRNVPRSIVRVG
jgi:hypothetical protein